MFNLKPVTAQQSDGLIAHSEIAMNGTGTCCRVLQEMNILNFGGETRWKVAEMEVTYRV